jgi:hypothetical protein
MQMRAVSGYYFLNDPDRAGHGHRYFENRDPAFFYRVNGAHRLISRSRANHRDQTQFFNNTDHFFSAHLILSGHARAAAFHYALHIRKARHGGIAGRRHCQRSVGRAAIYGVLRGLAA